MNPGSEAMDVTEAIPNANISTDADLYREEAARARRYAAATKDKAVIGRLNQIAELYEALAAGQQATQTDLD